MSRSDLRPEPTPAAQVSAPPTLTPNQPTCGCGHTRDHYAVSAEASYSAWGWFCNLFGITAEPKRLDYRCRQCDQVFDTSDDPKLLGHHI